MYSLAPYRVTIKTLSTSKSFPLWDPKGNGFPIWLHQYLKAKLGILESRPDKRIVRVSKLCTNADYTFVCGLLQTGKYGYTAELLDTKASQVSHERSTAEAEMIPFFFSLAAPMQAEWAVLTLQKFQNLGIYEFFIPNLLADFTKAFPGLRLDIERLVPSTLAKALLQDAEVKALRFISHKMPKAVEDALGAYDYDDHVSTTEIVVKAKRRGALPKIEGFIDVLSGTKNLSDVVTMPDWNYSSVKLDLEVNGRRRTIDVGKPYKINPTVDITELAEEGPDGHPIWEDVMGISAELAGDYLANQYPGTEISIVLVNNDEAPKIASAMSLAEQDKAA